MPAKRPGRLTALAWLAAFCTMIVPVEVFGEGIAGPEVVVRYGAGFSADRARSLAWAKAWLDGLETAGSRLAGWKAVRLAGLDSPRRQALASLAGMVGVSVLSKEAEAPSGTAPDPDAPAGIFRPEGEAVAVAIVREVDPAELSRLLGLVDDLDRREDFVVTLRRLLPEALEWAEEVGVLPERMPGLASSGRGETSPEGSAGERLTCRAEEIEALLMYLKEQEEGASSDPPEIPPASGPDVFLLRLAEAEDLLRQDRPQAARRLLAGVPPAAAGRGEGLPPAEPSLKEIPKGQRLREEDWSSAWTEAWTARPSDRRMHARALYLRALALLRTGRPALAEEDLDGALLLAPDRGELWLARGAARQVRERFGLMCDDYYRACALGRCDGLAAARGQGRCLPEEARGKAESDGVRPPGETPEKGE